MSFESGVASLVGVKSGMILMWAGSTLSIPAGWALCDGTNSTPDLRNRFIVGAGSTYAVNDTGGEATHVLTTAEMPAHTHNIHKSSGAGLEAGLDGGTNCTNYSGGYIESTGGDTAHENRPPYFALAYIMKV